MIMPSKKGLLCLSKPALHFFHHPFRVVVTVVGGRLPTCSQLMSLSQLALVKMQSLHKCVGVSGSLLHSLHSVSCGQPLFAKLSAVKIFFWSRSQAKKRHFGSVLAFQIGWNNDVLVRPMNWIRYALFVVYSPLGVHRQVISSSALVSLACSWITSHNSAYSLISTPVVNGRTRSIQWFPCSAFCTERFFLLDFWNRCGAKFFGDEPFNQVECQKSALLPLPTLTIVEVWNKSLFVLSQGIASPVHGHSSFFHWNQSHLSLSARASCSRSSIPSPPQILWSAHWGPSH